MCLWVSFGSAHQLQEFQLAPGLASLRRVHGATAFAWCLLCGGEGDVLSLQGGTSAHIYVPGVKQDIAVYCCMAELLPRRPSPLLSERGLEIMPAVFSRTWLRGAGHSCLLSPFETLAPVQVLST